MNYNELTFLAKDRKITLADLAEQIGLTRQGLQSTIERGTFPTNKVLPLCQILGITPNEFFGWDAPLPVGGNYASHVSGGNTQNSNEAIKALRDQLKEKDKQINRLLGVIERWKNE